MAASTTEARERLMAVIDTAYAADGLSAEPDRLNDSLGHQGTRIGVTVDRADAMSGRHNVLRVSMTVRFFGYYDLRVDPEQAVDPTPVEAAAQKLQDAIQDDIGGGTSQVWFMNLDSIEFPDDPTGNKTRFLATVIAFGDNPSIIETS